MKSAVLDSAASETSFTVDGQSYILRYDFDAIAAFEQALEINPVLAPLPPTMLNLMCLLSCGLKAHHPDVSMATVKSWFNQKTAPELCKLAWESFYGALPERKPEAENAAEAAPPDPPSA